MNPKPMKRRPNRNGADVRAMTETTTTTATGRRGREATDRVCVGTVTGARGLKGEVRIRSFTAEPEDVVAYGPVSDKAGKRRFDIHITGRVKGALVARIAGVGDRDAAEALKGTELYVPRSALPEPEVGTYYHADLLGLRVETEDGAELGRVKAVHNFGAGDLLEVAGKGSHGAMLPFTAGVVTVDLRKGLITVAPPAGLLAGDGDDAQGKQPGKG
jgi:16S rRNA processing protein RimM